ncbi:hypothetical protein UO65_0154 [Actinokineospora spheciospongiae]|uniref:Uncharacterized protein n=1 Tax=Actinokineospora spheciospongiae TaxID=909613 RepID=W7J6B2_9PSEU|nr:hypothetical protein [Actinokineospora spheciospongiae]EWC64547.1 hypothetical protein UO65_0154 [Actinokineospora spheciospongiae]
MTSQDTPDIEIDVRRFTVDDCEVTVVVADPLDAQQTLYGTVTRHGVLVGSYYCADRIRQREWRVVPANTHDLTVDGRPVHPVDEAAAVLVLTNVLTAPAHEIDQRLREVTRPAQ